MKLIQSKDINNYSLLMNELLPDFGDAFLHTILLWCGLLNNVETEFWEIWIVKSEEKTIGICGLYCLVPDKKEFWLGWLGIMPSMRNQNIGKIIMEHLYKVATENNVNTILSYVDKNGAPLNFYKREGFKVIGTVEEYLKENSLEVYRGSFGDINDFIIRKIL